MNYDMESLDGRMQEHLDAWTSKISNAVHLLYQWHVLHYTGHFIECAHHVKETIDGVNIKTEEVLKSFGYKIHESSAPVSSTETDATL